MYAWSVQKHAVVAALCTYAQSGEDAAKRGGWRRALNSHGNYIADNGKSWKNHGIVFLNFLWEPCSFNFFFSSVSVVNYLPVDNLRRLIHTAFKKVKVKRNSDLSKN